MRIVILHFLFMFFIFIEYSFKHYILTFPNKLDIFIESNGVDTEHKFSYSLPSKRIKHILRFFLKQNSYLFILLNHHYIIEHFALFVNSIIIFGILLSHKTRGLRNHLGPRPLFLKSFIP